MTTPTDTLTPALLARTAARLASRPEFCAFFLARARERTGQSEAEQAAALGCSVESLHRIALCFAPRPGRTPEDVAEVCSRFGAEVGALAEMLRDQETDMGPRPTTTYTLHEIIARHPEDFHWLERNGSMIAEWDLDTPFVLLAEENGTAVYVAEDDSVIEIHPQAEPNIVVCDPAYARMVRAREAR